MKNFKNPSVAKKITVCSLIIIVILTICGFTLHILKKEGTLVSEPLRNYNPSETNPESYNPKTKPEILSMLGSDILPIQVGNTQIIRCEVITVPEARFIGKHYDGYPNWGEAWANGWFEKIEAMGAQSPVNDGSYCVLYGNDNNHWLGEFMEPGTPAPEGLDAVEIPESKAVLFFIKGQQSDCYKTAYDTEALNGLINQLGLTPPDENKDLKTFERDNCPRFTDPDEDGNLILDYIVMLDN